MNSGSDSAHIRKRHFVQWRKPSCGSKRWFLRFVFGYEYNGQTYRSLSVIARAITGTRWSGPAFFGIKRRARKVDGE